MSDMNTAADVVLATELDDAVEARMIDVLSKVMTTNRYPELKSAIISAVNRHAREEAAANMQAIEQQKQFAQQAMIVQREKQMRADAQNAFKWGDYQERDKYMDELRKAKEDYNSQRDAMQSRPGMFDRIKNPFSTF